MKYVNEYLLQTFAYALVCIQLLQNHVCHGVSYKSVFLDDDVDYADNVGQMKANGISMGDFSFRERRSAHTETVLNTSDLKDIGGTVQNPPIITQFALNNSHHQIMVDWAGAGSKVVVCVSKDIDQNISSTTNVYISYDYGETFQDKSNDFKIKNKHGIIYKFYKNDKFTDRFIFADIVNNYLFVTNDYGHTIYPRELEFVPSEISIHPSDSLVFLIMDRKDSMKRLWITNDFGSTFNVLSPYVKSYYWSKSDSGPTLYVEREEPGNENTVIAFKTFNGDNFSYRVVTEGVQEFVLKEDFLFAVKRKRHLLGARTPHEDGLQLWISYKDGPFFFGRIPKQFNPPELLCC